MSKLSILVLHGPNLNLLGSREPGHYGSQTLIDIDQQLIALGDQLNAEVHSFQSNHEGEIVERIHQAARESVHGIVINPAAYTHTSVAIRDALLAVGIPFVEVHLSNIHRRESFRHHSYLSDIATGMVAGFGAKSYLMALRGLCDHISSMQGKTAEPVRRP